MSGKYWQRFINYDTPNLESFDRPIQITSAVWYRSDLILLWIQQQTYGQQSYGSYAQPAAAAADNTYTQATPAAGSYTQQQPPQQYSSSYGQAAQGM